MSTHSDWAINCFLFAAAGTISQAMHNAARDLRAAIIVANLDPLRAVPVLRVPGTGREPELNVRLLDPWRWVHKTSGRS